MVGIDTIFPVSPTLIMLGILHNFTLFCLLEISRKKDGEGGSGCVGRGVEAQDL